MSNQLFKIQEKSENKKYSKKIMAPQYVPNKIKPNIEELCTVTQKYAELIQGINNSSVDNKEKDFLRKAATRHLVFNYAKIADYYAHATPEMQKLMEQSALVIIDMDDAIANGYVRLSETILDIIDGAKNG